MNNIVELKIDNDVWQGRLDMTALANTQRELSKVHGKNLTMQDIFNGIAEQQFDIVIELIVQSLSRCQKIKRHIIENKLTLDKMETIFTYITELVQVAMPSSEEGKQIVEE